jgi:hypothetical protein
MFRLSSLALASVFSLQVGALSLFVSSENSLEPNLPDQKGALRFVESQKLAPRPTWMGVFPLLRVSFPQPSGKF